MTGPRPAAPPATIPHGGLAEGASSSSLGAASPLPAAAGKSTPVAGRAGAGADLQRAPGGPPVVLIVDDAAHVRDEVARALAGLEPAVQVVFAADGLQGFVALKQMPVDMVLCDVVMPNMDGFQLLKVLREQPALADLPVILLTGQEDVREKVRGFALGAADYVVKPCNPAELCARVRVHLKVRLLQAELREKNARLEALVREDPLTGLKNRRAFDELLAHHFAQAERYRTPLGLTLLDIDHFKRVNDVYGHPAGDRALKAVADCLVATARLQDVVVRFGGEEFAVLMPHTDLAGATLAAQRHRVRIAAIDGSQWDGPPSITASFGVAAAPRGDLLRAEDFVQVVDSALYRAKGLGRNCVVEDAEPVAGAR